MHRRRFLRDLVLGGTALTVLPGLGGLAETWRVPRVVADPVRVRGRVTAAGRGLARVAVTDGLTVVDTDAEGRFELVASSAQPFVYLSLPAGYAIPQSATGTARHFAPLTPANPDLRFDLVPLPAGDERHAFVALADPQTQNAYEMERFHAETIPDVAATVRAFGDVPTFGVAVGDIMFDDLSLYPEYERAVGRTGAPFFQVVGNHDLDFDAPADGGSTATFRRHFGPTYYSFDRGAVHYVVLDDVLWHGAGYIGYLDDAQLGWLAQDLARVEAGRPVVVFTHIPALSTRFRRVGEAKPSESGSITNREALYALLAPYAAHIVSGHTHEHEHVFEGGVHEHVLATSCGAWWSGPICYDGTPSGYAVFEARGEDLRWRYQATGGGADHGLRLYPRGADPSAPDEIVANIWDWDPAWRVVLYEGSDRRGAMGRRTGLDPLSVRLHEGPARPQRRPWVDPVPTDHLFYAPLQADAADVTVEATDPWGRTYTASMRDAVDLESATGG